MVAALALDHVGALGLELRPITGTKLLGAALLVVSVVADPAVSALTPRRRAPRRASPGGSATASASVRAFPSGVSREARRDLHHVAAGEADLLPEARDEGDHELGIEAARLGRAGRVRDGGVGAVDVVREVDPRDAAPRGRARRWRRGRRRDRARTSSAQNWRTPSVDSQCARSRAEARVPTCTSRPPRPRRSFAWNDQVAKQ